MNCQQCGNELQTDERVVFNKRETFVFKPAHVQDQEVFKPDGNGGMKKINLAATLSPDALRESRQDHLKTEIATVYMTVGKAEVPEGAFNFRHARCRVQRTGSVASLHPLGKHDIRWARNRKRGA